MVHVFALESPVREHELARRVFMTRPLFGVGLFRRPCDQVKGAWPILRGRPLRL